MGSIGRQSFQGAQLLVNLPRQKAKAIETKIGLLIKENVAKVITKRDTRRDLATSALFYCGGVFAEEFCGSETGERNCRGCAATESVVSLFKKKAHIAVSFFLHVGREPFRSERQSNLWAAVVGSSLH